MITWLASYPKSGNTWVRMFLKSYLRQNNEKFSINNMQISSHIQKFPNIDQLIKSNINYTNFDEIIKNSLFLQQRINLTNKSSIFKTHSALYKIKNFKFTDIDNTNGVIYIVRDPRDVAVSYSHHMNKSIDETIKNMSISTNGELQTYNEKQFRITLMGSWSDNYNSWKNFKAVNPLIIKYEDMKNNTKEEFTKIVKYLENLGITQTNDDKIQASIDQTNFEKLKSEEIENGFAERPIDNKKMNFFRKGKVGEWKEILNQKQSSNIEKLFKKEMSDLGYI